MSYFGNSTARYLSSYRKIKINITQVVHPLIAPCPTPSGQGADYLQFIGQRIHHQAGGI